MSSVVIPARRAVPAKSSTSRAARPAKTMPSMSLGVLTAMSHGSSAPRFFGFPSAA
jgi:hypothetical protein